jgi:hypothetical protein
LLSSTPVVLTPARTAIESLVRAEMSVWLPILQDPANGAWQELDDMADYQEFGDPSTPIYTSAPKTFALSGFSSQLTGKRTIMASLAGQPAADGAIVTALDANGGFLGRGVLAKGTATIEADQDIGVSAGVTFVLSKTGFVPGSVQ